MLNHSRCLLLNLLREENVTVLGEEIVPADFRPIVSVPRVVQKIRTILFGNDPDREMLNYRLHQLMPLLHVTGFEQFVLTRDERISYWPLQPRYNDSSFGAVVTPADSRYRFVGQPVVDEVAGKMAAAWNVTIAGNEVTVDQTSPRKHTVVETVSFANDLSSLVPLQGASFQVRFRSGVAGLRSVTTTARPARGIAELFGFLQSGLGNDDEQALFGRTPTGDRLTWYNLWRDSPFFPYRMAGLLFAVVAAMEDSR